MRRISCGHAFCVFCVKAGAEMIHTHMKSRNQRKWKKTVTVKNSKYFNITWFSVISIHFIWYLFTHLFTVQSFTLSLISTVFNTGDNLMEYFCVLQVNKIYIYLFIFYSFFYQKRNLVSFSRYEGKIHPVTPLNNKYVYILLSELFYCGC